MSYNPTYTIQLRQIVDSDGLFTFEFDFYTGSYEIQKDFAKRFIEKYYFHEIGQETVGQFKNRMQQRLNALAPKYEELYKIEVERAKLNYLFNKDLKETTTVKRNGIGSTLGCNDSKSNVITNGSNKNTHKESSLNNGNATIDKDSSLTTENETTDTVDTQNNTFATIVSDNRSITNDNEDTVFLSQGNIGITTSADLVDSWRNNVVDLNMQLIDEFSDLFMMIY